MDVLRHHHSAHRGAHHRARRRAVSPSGDSGWDQAMYGGEEKVLGVGKCLVQSTHLTSPISSSPFPPCLQTMEVDTLIGVGLQ